MTQQIQQSLRDNLVHLGAMPGEAEIMANYADNELPAGATFAEAIDYIKKHFEI